MLPLGTRDYELIQKALAGHGQSLDVLAGVVRLRVYSYVRRVTLDEHKADDVTQDTLLAVLTSIRRLRKVDRFWAWVFTIATNKVRQYGRAQAVRWTIPISGLDGNHVQLRSRPGEDGPGALSRQESGELTRQAMRQLGLWDRMILVLRFYKDMPHAEIARMLGCSEPVARVSLFRAKHSLKHELARLGGAHDAPTAVAGRRLSSDSRVPPRRSFSVGGWPAVGGRTASANGQQPCLARPASGVSVPARPADRCRGG
jgi:RNA polymerase sigma-70 factor, ECF subfamily